jgi:hypothetical protein
MLLFELFEDQTDDDLGDNGHDDGLKPQTGGQMTQQIRQAALDVITPLLGQNVPFITMEQLIDRLSNARFGIVITPALIMAILNPDDIKAISKIEGNRIYLQGPGVADSEHDDQHDVEQDKKHVGDMAVDQINQELKSK